MSFLDDLKNNAYTENGALTNKSTKSAVLDLFYLGGACRNMSGEEISLIVKKAFIENRELTLKCLFYLGDVRGGLGEKRLFRIGIGTIIKNYAMPNEYLFDLIIEYTSWKTFFNIMEDYCEIEESISNVFLNYAAKKMLEDKDGKTLVWKWVQTPKWSNKVDYITDYLSRKLNMSKKQYRKLVVENRKKLRIVETQMCENNWNEIDFSKVPSRASLNYRKTFEKHTPERYGKFLESVVKGEEKLNTALLYPHDIVHRILFDYDNSSSLDVMWNNLPSYNVDNCLPLIDVSGSMGISIGGGSKCRAIEVAIGFGLYFAEHNLGDFKNHFITFSECPELVEVRGKIISEKTYNIKNSNWGYNTDLQKVFDLILSTAKRNHTKKEDMPKTLMIFSDMEFDEASKRQETNFEAIKRKYLESGYEMPQIVFWNICARNKQTPATMNDQGVALVSGYSPSVVKFITSGEIKTPWELMLDILESVRYNRVVW